MSSGRGIFSRHDRYILYTLVLSFTSIQLNCSVTKQRALESLSISEELLKFIELTAHPALLEYEY